MTRIDGPSHLTTLVRKHVAAMGKLAGTSPTGTMQGRAERPSGGPPGQVNTERDDLAKVLASRVHAIAADDPDGQRKALRVLLETALLDQFGEDLIEDPAFYQMVDHVQVQMEADQELAVAIEAAARLLISGHSSPTASSAGPEPRSSA